MRPIRRILVAVKNPASRELPAVTKAAQLARALDAELVLFHALTVPLYLDSHVGMLDGSLTHTERTTRKTCLERLEATARTLRRKGCNVACSAQWSSPVYEAVIRAAARMGADLIVAERHGRRHIAAGLLHLTDWELLRLSPVPVLLVKRPQPYRRPLVLAAVDPDHSYEKPSRLDREILQAGVVIAKALRGALHAVHAYVPLPLTAYAGGTLSVQQVDRMQAQSARVAGEKLQRAVRSVGIPKFRLHLIGRHPADAIEQAAAETRSAVVVMGAISRSGLKRLLIGNTAEEVLDRLTCDLLIIKPAGLIKRVPRVRQRPPHQSAGKPAAAAY